MQMSAAHRRNKNHTRTKHAQNCRNVPLKYGTKGQGGVSKKKAIFMVNLHMEGRLAHL